MAKKTKDSNLSIEERLEQALIPNWDEPYKLPSNWCWVKLSAVCSLEKGQKSSEKDLVYLDAKTLRGVTEPKTRDNGIIVNKDQKVILVDGENSGEVFVVPYRGYMGSTFKIINMTENADEMYIRYFIDQNREKLRNNKIGSAIPHLNKDLFFNLELPFPPLSEQKRIVSHIESLFAKLDEAKEKAQEVVDEFETRKAAILHKAFSGELTAKWREENDHSIADWEHHNFSDLCKIVRGGSPRPAGSPEFYGGDIPFMKVADITRITTPYVESTEHFIKPAGLKKTRMVKANTLLLTNSGATLGVPAICTFDTTFNDGIAAFLDLPSESLLFYYYFWTKKTPELRAINKGAAQPNLNTDIIGAVELDIPSLEEQKVITNILEHLITKEQQVKEAAEAVVEQIDTMKKAVLARAFRGELGTNDPTKASAIELIKQIIEEKIKAEESKLKRTLVKRKEVSFVAKTVLEVLKSSEKLTPEKLKAETALEIDDFYDQLKALINSGQVREMRIDGESYLEAVL